MGIDLNVSTSAVTALTDVTLSVQNIGKMYKLYDQPVDRLKDTLLWRFGKHIGREFWALRNISFQVQRGETIGILGKNGSGKSTLLQIIAGVLQSTEGNVIVNGRISALLELGSGFNPEYTGRENIFMGGAIQGLMQQEMQQRYDEITAFADIGEFIDQPVKLYSSGMFARLAFAIGIHVNPDIFIIDESLSVGDVFFQAKCFAKLDEYRNAGGTVLFVTHDTITTQRICTRAIVLNHGQMVFEGDRVDATNIYYKLEHGNYQITIPETKPTVAHDPDALYSSDWSAFDLSPGKVDLRRDFTTGNGSAVIEEAFIFNEKDAPTTTFLVGEWLKIYVKIKFAHTINEVSYGVGIRDKTGILIGGAHNIHSEGIKIHVLEGTTYLFFAQIKLDIAPGVYLLLIGAAKDYNYGTWEDYGVLWDCCSIQVVGVPKFWGQSLLPNQVDYRVIQDLS